MPRPCALCTHPDQAAVTAALASGASDRAIGRQFGISHVSVGRHRREHVVRPMQVAAAALDKGRAVRERREQLVQGAQEGNPLDFIALTTIVQDVRTIHQRLDRMAEAAEQRGSAQGVAQLSGQQLRAAEVRSRLGGHDRPPATNEGATLSVHIQIGDKTISFEATPTDGPPVIDGGVDEQLP